MLSESKHVAKRLVSGVWLYRDFDVFLRINWAYGDKRTWVAKNDDGFLGEFKTMREAFRAIDNHYSAKERRQ